MQSHGLCLPGSSVQGILQARTLEWAAKKLARCRLSHTEWVILYEVPVYAKKSIVIEVGLMVASEESNHWKGHGNSEVLVMLFILIWRVITQVSSFCKNSSIWTFMICALFCQYVILNLKVHIKKKVHLWDNYLSINQKSYFGIQKQNIGSFSVHSDVTVLSFPKALDASGWIAEDHVKRSTKRKRTLIYFKNIIFATLFIKPRIKRSNRCKLKLWYNFSR